MHARYQAENADDGERGRAGRPDCEANVERKDRNHVDDIQGAKEKRFPLRPTVVEPHHILDGEPRDAYSLEEGEDGMVSLLAFGIQTKLRQGLDHKGDDREENDDEREGLDNSNREGIRREAWQHVGLHNNLNMGVYIRLGTHKDTLAVTLLKLGGLIDDPVGFNRPKANDNQRLVASHLVLCEHTEDVEVSWIAKINRLA